MGRYHASACIRRLPGAHDDGHRRERSSDGNVLLSLSGGGLFDETSLRILQDLSEGFRSTSKSIKILLQFQREPEQRDIISVLGQTFTHVVSFDAGPTELPIVVDIL